MYLSGMINICNLDSWQLLRMPTNCQPNIQNSTVHIHIIHIMSYQCFEATA